MEHRNIISGKALLAACALCTVACGSEENALGSGRGALIAECTDSTSSELPPDAWLCPEPRSVECTSGNGTEDVDTLYVQNSSDSSCDDGELVLSDAGPFAVGVHTISVSDEGGARLCSAELTVTDTAAPIVTPQTIQLWPPNHKFHSISVADCVQASDACDGDLVGEFIWASSDEPVDDKGDGHHTPDILIDDCQHVSVRAERAGPKNGRVYKLGVRFVDGSGLSTESECVVIVDHDQRGVQGADDGESYRITFDGSADGPACDGIVEDPTPPPGGGDDPTDPPVDGGDPTDPPVEDPGPIVE